MSLRKVIRSVINENFGLSYSLYENIQLADKIYFNTGKLSQQDKDIILGITSGDNYTKIISDFYYYLKNNSFNRLDLNRLKVLYNELKNYNKNIFPIEGFDIYKTDDAYGLLSALESRKKIIDNFKNLPSIASRNMKSDIRAVRKPSELFKYLSDLDYFMSHYSLLGNRDEKMQAKILQKMFKADTTLQDLMRFTDDKESLLGGFEFTKDAVKKMSEQEDFEVIYEQGDVMIVRVDSPEGIKAIGCNSLWCFTYGSGFDSAYRQWSNYSHNDMVYVLIDFKESTDSSDFMHVLIKPILDEYGELIEYDENEDEYPLFNMANENYYDPYSILGHLFGKNYEEVVKNYLNFEY